MKEILKKTKEQKGSITLFVLESMIFFIILTIGIYISSNNKVQKQDAELNKIKSTYEQKDINEIYKNNIDKTAPTAPTITAKLGSDSGNEYISGTWTNQPVIISASSTDNLSKINRIEYSYDKKTWKTDWGNNLEINGNQASIKGKWNSNHNRTIYIRAVDNAENVSELSSIVLKQDKVAPTVPIIIAKLGSDSGNEYISGTWTNQPVIISASSTDNLSEINRIEYSYNNKNWFINWGNNLEINGKEASIKGTWNSNYDKTIYVRAVDNAGNASESSSIVLKQDKTIPTAILSPNGGSYTKPTSGYATIKTRLTVEDTGGSELDILQYAWSTSKTIEPTTWETFTNEDTVSKTDCSEGVYYLWTNIYDKAGNRATNVKVSNSFIVNN